MIDKPYQPIKCADYDIYEIAIMQGHFLSIKFSASSGEVLPLEVRPVELKIKDRAEFLIFETQDKQKMEVRLDNIKYAEII